jgi:large subunit ribosomal protein L29
VKKKDLRELRDLSPEELARREVELREELFVLMMRRGASQLENPKRLWAIRKDVARILTVLGEKNKGAAAAAPSEV